MIHFTQYIFNWFIWLYYCHYIVIRSAQYSLKTTTKILAATLFLRYFTGENSKLNWRCSSFTLYTVDEQRAAHILLKIILLTVNNIWMCWILRHIYIYLYEKMYLFYVYLIYLCQRIYICKHKKLHQYCGWIYLYIKIFKCRSSKFNPQENKYNIRYIYTYISVYDQKN